MSPRLARDARLPAPFADRVIVGDAQADRAGAALRDYLVELAR